MVSKTNIRLFWEKRFPQAYSDCANDEMRSILEDGKLAFMAIEDGHLVGFIGAMPQYGVTGWELHLWEKYEAETSAQGAIK